MFCIRDMMSLPQFRCCLFHARRVGEHWIQINADWAIWMEIFCGFVFSVSLMKRCVVKLINEWFSKFLIIHIGIQIIMNWKCVIRQMCIWLVDNRNILYGIVPSHMNVAYWISIVTISANLRQQWHFRCDISIYVSLWRCRNLHSVMMYYEVLLCFGKPQRRCCIIYASHANNLYDSHSTFSIINLSLNIFIIIIINWQWMWTNRRSICNITFK